MENTFTKEQLEICGAVKDLCKTYLNEKVWEEEEHCVFNREKWKRIADFGVFALPFEEKIGGLEQSFTTTALVVKTLAKYCFDEGLVFSVCAQLSATQVPLWLYGTEEIKKRYLVPLIEGSKTGASVISEPDTGSDAASIKMRIKSDEQNFYLNGVKTFATLGPVADILLVYGKHPGGLPMLDISGIILEKGEYEIGRKFIKRSWPMCRRGI